MLRRRVTGKQEALLALLAAAARQVPAVAAGVPQVVHTQGKVRQGTRSHQQDHQEVTAQVVLSLRGVIIRGALGHL